MSIYVHMYVYMCTHTHTLKQLHSSRGKCLGINLDISFIPHSMSRNFAVSTYKLYLESLHFSPSPGRSHHYLF